MKRRLLISVLLGLLLLCGSAAWLLKAPVKTFRGGLVHIEKTGDGFRLIRNGKQFEVRGAAGAERMKELAAAGGNTIRTYDTTGLEHILDSASAYGLAVIAGIYLPHSNYSILFYDNDHWVDSSIQQLEKTVLRYKDHPALLAWCLGNEVYFPHSPFTKKFYAAYNKMVGVIHDHDPAHPVTTALNNFDIATIVSADRRTDVDFLSFNIFGNDLRQFKQRLDRYAYCWNGPYLLAEWGIDGPWVESGRTAWLAPVEPGYDEKARRLEELYTRSIPHRDNRYIGALVFYWGYKQETTPSWFSFFSFSGAASPMVRTMQSLWTGRRITPPLPEIDSVSIDGAVGHSLVLTAGSIVKARVNFLAGGHAEDCHWYVLPEDWVKPVKNYNSEKFLLPVDGVVVSASGDTAVLRLPQREGAYRLYVEASDTLRNFTGADLPFFILDKP